MSKKIIILSAILVLMFSLSIHSQDLSLEDLETGFQGFSDSVANALPYAATLGTTWSDAYIGGFPHLGVGAFAGGVILPLEGVQSVMDATGLSDSLPQFVQDFSGLPFPVFGANARLGGIALPFDIGAKFGMLPEDTSFGDSFYADYLMAGIDVRVPIIRGNLLLPDVIIGAGYTYLSGGVGLMGLFGSNQTIFDETIAENQHTVEIQDPDIAFSWESNVIDLRAQVSKGLLIFTPYAGLGAGYGFSNAGGGITSALLINGEEATQEEIDQLNETLEAAGQETLNVDPTGYSITSEAGGWAFRVFGGVSLDILILKLDVGASYNLTSGSYAGELGVRLQL